MMNLNTSPYFDDFNADNKFYRILFRPGIAVQARELTQLQTSLQNQISTHGDHIFKEGAMVIPGQMSIDSNHDYVKLQAAYLGNSIEGFLPNIVGSVITGQTGLTATVIKVVLSEGSDLPTLYVRYTNSGSNGTTKTFVANEVLTISSTTNVSLNTQLMQVASLDPVGKGTIATIERGVYYIKGFFVLADSQSYVVSKYSNSPSARVGLTVIEQLITPEDDETLLDNAQGSYNFAAPGAHRLFIDLVLSSRELSSPDDENFIELLRVQEGVIQRHVTKTEYSELEKTLARRTFDESGDYTVRNFAIDVREHRNNNRGSWATNTSYLIGDVVTSNNKTYTAKTAGTSSNSAPQHESGTATDGSGGVLWEFNQYPYYNRGVFTPENGGDETKLAIGLEPGKAYVRGYEIEKIATEYIPVNKARNFTQVTDAVIPATVGNYIFVHNINGLPPVDTYGIVTLYDRLTDTAGRGTGVGTAVGQARARFFEWDRGVIGETSAVYKLGLFDIQMYDDADFSRKVKSVFFNVSDAPALSFSADIQGDVIRLIGSVTASGSTTITGSGTSFQTDLLVGDYIQLNTGESAITRRVTSIASQTQLTVDQLTTVSGVTVNLLKIDVREPENVALVYQLPYYAIKSVRSSINTNTTAYTVYQKFTTSNASPLDTETSTCSVVLSTGTGTFASEADPDNYVVLNNDPSTGGEIIVPLSITRSGATVTITLPGEYASKSIHVIAAINRVGASLTEKTKTLTPSVRIITSLAEATSPEIILQKADGYRLISVKMMDGGTFAEPTGEYTIDITDRYDFDNGQRPTHYDRCRLFLKPSYTAPTAPIQVTFDYFNHTQGDYFTVNSYTAGLSYEAIPPFNGVALRDAIDFRPRISDDGTTFAGDTIALTPKRGVDITTDFQYYLARKTKIAISFDGKFFTIDGVSSLTPGEPSDPSEGMVLYTLTIEPYTFGTSSDSVIVTGYDNKRYTMRDIGRLEKRIDNLEYYTSLSLLEQQTESLDIVDANGESRFKNGFIVDNFTGHTTGDITSPDYLCSIDMEKGELRPFFSMQNLRVIEQAINDQQRSLSNYKLYGDVITLPLDSVTPHVPLVTQEYASRIENINPFAVFTFLGNMELTPATDDWFEVNRRPDIVVEVEGNFNTVKALAEKAGVLGTVWNAWQTQWTGTSTTSTVKYTAGTAWASGKGDVKISVSEMQKRFGKGTGGNINARQVTVQSTATQVGQQRSGVKTTIVSKVDRQVVADRVLSTAAIPYIRSRNVLVQVRGLKPETRFYPFFDNVNVSQYCTPASRLAFNPVVGQASLFDTTTNVGGLASEQERRINGDSQVCLTRGDVIKGQQSNATAVVVGREFNPDTGAYALFIVNIVGTFSANETIIGSVSGAQGTFTSLTTASQGGPLISNFSGDVALLFNIPNTESERFRTGVREFKMVDTTEAEGEFTSRGRQMYHAQGVLETRQQTVNAVRNAELVAEQLTENRVIVQTSERVVADTGWWDPLAQTFLVEQTGGAFLTKVDIFFATKDPKIPVNLEIREVVNGYPGKLVLPFSKVSLKPEEVMLSNNTVLLNDVQTRSYDTPTTFTFPSPVYVQHNTEYALVLSSDSNNYKVWISNVGDAIPGSSRTISEQPYQGVLFKSQNASTWTPNDWQDLKFTIYRAKFATDTVANIVFTNDAIPFQQLDFDPIETKVGATKVRVYQRDHGMPVGSAVILDDLDATKITGVLSTGSITVSTTSSPREVTGTNTVFTSEVQVGSLLYTTSDVYVGQVLLVNSNTSLTLTADTPVNLTSQGFKSVRPIAGIPVNQIYKQHVVSDVDLDSYTVTVTTAPTQSGYFGGTTMRATRNLQFDEVQPSIQMQTFPETVTSCGIKSVTGRSVDGSQTAYVPDTDYISVLANESNRFTAPRMIASEVNEDGTNSMFFNVTMKTDVDNLSPILDTQRLSVIVVNNKVDAPQEVGTNVGGLDEEVIVSGSTLISFSGNRMSTSNATVADAFATVVVGKYVNITGTSGAANNGTFLVTGVEVGATTSIVFDRDFATQASGSAITVTRREFFVDEIAPVGSTTYSKYVTRQINLASAATFIRVRFAASIPAEAVVDVYYKTASTGATTPFEETPYTKINSDGPIVNVQNGSDQFIDFNFSTGDIPAFDSLQIKLVMRSTNSSAVPRIKDLRVIAAS